MLADHVGNGAFRVAKAFVGVFAIIGVAGLVGVFRYRNPLRVVSGFLTAWSVAVIARILATWKDVAAIINVVAADSSGDPSIQTDRLGELVQAVLGWPLAWAFPLIAIAWLTFYVRASSRPNHPARTSPRP